MKPQTEQSYADGGKRFTVPWWQTVFVLLPLCIGSAVSAHQHTLEHINLPAISIRVSGYLTVMVEEWLSVLFIWLALRRRGTPVSSLISGQWQNFGAFLRDLGLAVGFFIIAVPTMAIMTRLIRPESKQIGFEPKTPSEAILWLGVAATAGFCEELIFRGYLMQQIEGWTDSRGFALILQGAVFGLAHGYQSKNMVVVAVYGWLLGLLALWRKSLRPGMLSHGFQDALVGLLVFFVKK